MGSLNASPQAGQDDNFPFLCTGWQSWYNVVMEFDHEEAMGGMTARYILTYLWNERGCPFGTWVPTGYDSCETELAERGGKQVVRHVWTMPNGKEFVLYI